MDMRALCESRVSILTTGGLISLTAIADRDNGAPVHQGTTRDAGTT